MKYMFLDESGDLGSRGSKYLVITALMVNNPKDLDRIIKNMRRNKFKKELKNANEIKANKSSVDLKEYMLKKLNKIDNSEIYCTVLEKRMNYSPFLRKDKNKLYNYVAGTLAKQISFKGHAEIRIDKSKGKQLLRQDFDDHFLKNLSRNSEMGKARIYHSYSHSWSGLQFVDLIAWSYFQKFEHNNNSFVDLITLECDLHQIWKN